VVENHSALRIAINAPLIEAVPPPLYGGTERVIAVLVDELVQRGHAVTLFASGDSQTRATLVPTCPRGLRLDPEVKDYVAATLISVGEVFRRADDFDLIHNHVDYFAFPFARMTDTPTITTVHGRIDLPEVQRLYRAFPEHRLVSISHAQRTPVPELNWVGNVYNGIDLGTYHFRPAPGDYLVFLGRISPEKRPDRAIEIARDVDMRIILAAKVDQVDQAYFEHAIAPMIQNYPRAEFIGEVNEQEKDALLGGAYAYLFPIDWPEPFGLTMAESMATGTPVVASRSGATPEVVVDGVTGFVCASLHDLVEAVARVKDLDRGACRAHVERHFSPAAMASGYEEVFRAVLAGGTARAREQERRLIPEPPAAHGLDVAPGADHAAGNH
jgi:glycosyltransferase involved in cell wall biosynthesis